MKLKKIKLRKEIKSGTMIPVFYGVAYVDYSKNLAVCYPLFINLFVIILRDCHFWLKHPKGRS